MGDGNARCGAGRWDKAQRGCARSTSVPQRLEARSAAASPWKLTVEVCVAVEKEEGKKRLA